MTTGKLKLLLADLEAEVVQEALELYVAVRPVPIDLRVEYRYRAAQAVLESLRRGPREQVAFPIVDDEGVIRGDGERPERRPRREQLED